MSKRLEYVNKFYNQIDEDSRLSGSRQGQLEYATTMHYFDKFVQKGSKVLEIGAGTGRYSIALAKDGYDVTAVELVEHNLEVLQKNSLGMENIQSFQGDALDLSRFEDETFDVTLVLGPMYHLYEEEDVHKALDEAIRVTKSDGVVFVAFLSVYAIMMTNYLYGNFAEGFKENFEEDYTVKHFEHQFFTGYGVEEFEALFDKKNITYLSTVATDGVLEIAERRNDFQILDEDFDSFVRYHLATCEKRELLGYSSHLLYICKKKKMEPIV